MGHNKSNNALFVRASEHQAGASGAASGAGASSAAEAAHGAAKFQQLPFNCCAISLQPWEHPVCARGDKLDDGSGKEALGTIFDLANVLPFLKKYGGVNPATGGKLSASDLIPLHFTEREAAQGSSKAGASSGEVEYVDPVSYKVFNEFTHIVAIKSTGNVYAWETIERLNLKAKHMRDLLTEEPFTRADIIHLQDPANVQGRGVRSLHHVRAGLVLTEKERGIKREEEVNLGATGSAAKLLETIRAKTSKGAASESASSPPPVVKSNTADEAPASGSTRTEPVPGPSKVPYNLSHVSTGRVAASFTSSGLTPTTKTERQQYDEEEYMFEQVSKGIGFGAEGAKAKGGVKAYVRLTTNFGPLNLELHVDRAPKTCYNFLTHVKQGYYNDTIFHRNIPGFMIQGGDPTGTGRGGESIWGQPFRDELDAPGAYRHTERGTLSMANKGPGTNGSQFFLTYKATPHLDKKHTVFGRLVNETDAELSTLERVPTDPSTDRPLRSIRILEASVFDDPFDLYKAQLDRRLARDNLSAGEQAERERKRKWREEDRVTWLGTNLGTKAAGPTPSQPKASGQNAGVGKYLGGQGMPKASNTSADGRQPKAKKARGFGDFSGW